MAYVNGSQQRGGKAYRQHQTLKKYIRERDNYTCQLCGEEGWIVDHIIPYAISGDSTLNNLRILCHNCNLITRRKRYDANPCTSLDKYFRYIERELKQEIGYGKNKKLYHSL